MIQWQQLKRRKNDRNNFESKDLTLSKNQLKQTHLMFNQAVLIKQSMRALNQKNKFLEQTSSKTLKKSNILKLFQKELIAG